MRKFSLFVLVALVFVMVVTACGGDGGATAEPTAGPSTTSDTTSGTQATATTAAEVTQPTAEPTAEPTVEVAPTQTTEDTLSLENVSEGLTQLKSYKSKLDMRFSGKDAQGQAVEKSWTMEEEFIVDPRAQHITWTGSESTGGQAAEITSYEITSIGQSMYIISRDASGAETCISTSSEDTTPPESTLSADMWGSVSDAQYVNTETVNGVRAKHYRWREGSLITFGFVSGKADTWVAVDGGYVVKQSLEATGKAVFLASTDEEGTTTWEWNVTDANGDFEIVPPPGCESAAQDIPILPDATEKTTLGDMVTYSTATPFADVVAFYKAEMPKAGWQPSGEPTEGEGFAFFEYTKEDRTASFNLSFDSSSQMTSVFISVTKQ